ncbi:IclR family transcriptional regulator C-terminal domain-containing protein [Streptomyces sp. BP-8]|uniref:IclR family transcriptional regulator C-terminal domain-containing protein n=1 Tax=Streptomyces sirii TaxID=3127701 RepID=A0ABZ2QD83_9ACTN
MSRYDDHRDGAGRPEPVVPTALAELLGRLTGAPDFWDRPCGDFGPLTSEYALSAEKRAHANSLYRLGSKALAREELESAADWLGAAAEAGHPGALFRLAALTTRVRGQGHESVRFLVAEAARHGHGDARELLAASAHHASAESPAHSALEDPQFVDEVRAGLRCGPPAEPATHQEGVRAGERPIAAAVEGTEAACAKLVWVPATGLGRQHGPERPATPWPADDPTVAEQPRRTPACGATGSAHGLLLPLPPEQPVCGPAATLHEDSGDRGDGGDMYDGSGSMNDGRGNEPWWSAHALRPAVLTEMARRTPVHIDTPQQWRAAAQALDILYLVDAAGGITTRALAVRTRLSPAAVAWLLHWLRGQHLISTTAGAHFPGPLMAMTRHPEQRAQLLQRTLTSLRDRLGAAVYVSGYMSGDVRVLQSAYGPDAPAVTEYVAFRDTAHASAVGKSLLAQLDFDGRMDHLARYRPIKLTDRTITNPRALFEALDGHGPHAAQFDLLEYSHHEVCVAFPLGIPGRATCVALSLPAGQRHRLLPTAHALSERSAALLLTLLLTEDPVTGRQPRATRASPEPDPAPAHSEARALPLFATHHR